MVRSCYRNSYKTSHNAFIQVVKSGNINEEKSKNTINYTNIELPKDFKMLSDNNNKVYYIIFSGWMFADEPDISLMQDYDYDITLNRCVSDILPKDNLEIKKGVSRETPSNNIRLVKDVCQLGRAKQRQLLLLQLY